MSRVVFDKLVDLVRFKLNYSDTNYRDCISVPERLAIFLYRLGNNTTIESVAETFGVGASSVRKV
jgi:hypothetical protein